MLEPAVHQIPEHHVQIEEAAVVGDQDVALSELERG